jgi:hypothetical protein
MDGNISHSVDRGLEKQRETKSESSRMGIGGRLRVELIESKLGREPIRAHLVQIAIISNHLNGKDTHVRGVRVFAPRESVQVFPRFDSCSPVVLHLDQRLWMG